MADFCGCIKMSSPDERPELYDAYDCEERAPLSQEYRDVVFARAHQDGDRCQEIGERYSHFVGIRGPADAGVSLLAPVALRFLYATRRVEGS